MEPHFQSTPFTTAASSLLAVLHHFKPEIALSRENEFDIWQKTATLPTRASSIYALATYAAARGIKPKVVVEKKEYDFPDYRFYRYTKKDIEHAAFTSNLHLQAAERDCVEIVEEEITFKRIKKELGDGKILIARLNTKPFRNDKRNTSNFLVLHGFSEGYFHIIDPAFRAYSIPEKILEDSFESLETRKFRDHRVLIFY
ncbi:hypothetical protein COV20_04210 [Candidatus Woesearchaeota archaeon CG10_big_fil_rev_8_21_14_0_10_45_16]|nr:MAG: hypothetical protein COV20_04210 [Candidatus Woesearchaeota archaeon CG10_big_fil_rev_8_21_14_0_10_45_16]